MAPALVTSTHEYEAEDVPTNGHTASDGPLEAKRGIKRQRPDQVTESRMSTPQRELLTPRAATPDVNHPDSQIEYFDNIHPEYEWIRLPKKRGYDLYRVNHNPDSAAFEMWMPLTAMDLQGQKVTMWAKMDTGSDPNLIELSTLQRLLGPDIERHLRAMTQDQYNLVSGAKFTAKHSVDLEFEAGFAKKKFTKVNFIVVEQSAKLADADGVPNVLLGYPFLLENSMVHKGLEYCHAAEPGQEVIARKAEDEIGGHGGPLPVVRVPKTGPTVPRPIGRPH